MEEIRIFIYVILGLLLFWGGVSFYFSRQKRGAKEPAQRQEGREKAPGAKLPCFVCGSLLQDGRQISSVAFPPVEGRTERSMHIRGCIHCLNGEQDRICPVCKGVLKQDEVLIARLYDRKNQRSHVHVLGCSSCTKAR